MLLFAVITSILLLSILFSMWIVRALDNGGKEMHRHLESGGNKFIRHVGGFGESTFTEIK